MVAARVFFLAFAALFATAIAGDVTLTYQTFTNRNCSGSAFTTQEFKGSSINCEQLSGYYYTAPVWLNAGCTGGVPSASICNSSSCTTCESINVGPNNQCALVASPSINGTISVLAQCSDAFAHLPSRAMVSVLSVVLAAVMLF